MRTYYTRISFLTHILLYWTVTVYIRLFWQETTESTVIYRVCQNRIYTHIYTVYLVISKPKIPYVHRIYMVLANSSHIRWIYMVLANPRHIRWIYMVLANPSHIRWIYRFWPTLVIYDEYTWFWPTLVIYDEYIWFWPTLVIYDEYIGSGQP